MVDQDRIQALLAGTEHDPFGVLGAHCDPQGVWQIRAWYPGAQAVHVIARSDARHIATLVPDAVQGFFEGDLGVLPAPPDYAFEVVWPALTERCEDPYRFGVVLGDLDLWLLSEGAHQRAHEVLGAHAQVLEGVAGTTFAVWAPNARRVSVVGPFNAWDGRRYPMRSRGASGIWELFLPGIAAGALYKFEILGQAGQLLPQKADPFGRAAELRPGTASRVTARLAVPSAVAAEARATANTVAAPISIYEVHTSSWRRHDDARHPWLDWDALADALIPYATDIGFTHLELLPVSEFPFDGSWGYQPVGLFAPTARHGDPAGLQRFVQRAQSAGLGVILDWVPGHFPSDAHGLARFDGSCLYEHEDPREGFHRDWNTLIYNYGRREVCNFLLCNALYWIDTFGVDGLRVDAVASMLYRDYSRPAGEWIPNRYGGRENLEAMDFLRRLNGTLARLHPHAITLAEESTAFPGVSRPVGEGGLGFQFKWNMGWMHDVLSYMAIDPVHRRYHHDLLTFGLVYAFSENFVLPLSHDEVVHGKGSLLGKMPGDRWQKFANLRALYAFMWTHPGKKLLFMGGEFAQGGEWNHDRGLDWWLLDDHAHAGVQRLVRDLNHLYRGLPALHALDCDPAGFEWIDLGDRDQSVLSYLRRGPEDHQWVMVVCNFTPVPRPAYRVGAPQPGRWVERLNSDAAVYGGSNTGNPSGLAWSTDLPWHGRPYSVELMLPPLGVLVLAWQPDAR